MTLRELRLDLGLTQDELAKTLKCSQDKISTIELGLRNLQIYDIATLIKAYNLTAKQIKKLILDSANEKD
jgi:transcriptional regulator with XRE-family HTH domain